MRIKLWIAGTSVAFYALLIDMCSHLDGWRFFEPFVFIAVMIAMTALGQIIFEETAA